MLSHPLFRNRWLPLILIAIVPALLWWTLNLPPLCAIDSTDAMFYYAYACNFSELVQRCGMLYYCVRFGTILPEAVFFHLFGAHVGFLLFSWLLSAASSICFYLFLARRYDRSTAWMGVVLWLINPAVILLMLFPYSIGQGVPMVFTAMLLCFLATEPTRKNDSESVAAPEYRGWLPTWPEVLLGMAAGALFIAAASAHLLIAISGLVLGGTWVLGSLRYWRSVLRTFPFVIIGAALVYVGASLIYWHLFGMAWLHLPVMEAIFLLTNVVDGLKLPAAEFFDRYLFPYAPPLLCIASVVMSLRSFLGRQYDFTLLGAAAGVCILTGFLWYMDAVKGHLVSRGHVVWLYYFYYFQCLLPSMTFVAAVMFGTLRQPPFALKHRPWATAIVWALLAAVAFYLPIDNNIPIGHLSTIIYISVGIYIAVAMALWFRVLARPALYAVLLLYMGAISFSSPFRLADFHQSRPSLDFANMGQQLTKLVPKMADDWRIVYFWYNGNSRAIHLAQSAQLHWFTRLPDKAGPAPLGSPSAEILSILRARPVGKVFLMSDTPADEAKVRESIEGLRAAGLKFETTEQVLLSGKYKIATTVVSFPQNPSPEDRAKGIPSTLTFKSDEPKAPPIDLPGGGARLTTSPVRYLWSLHVIPTKENRPPGADLVLKMRVTQGRIRFDFVLGSVTVPPTAEPIELRIPAAAVDKDGTVPISSDWVDKLPATVEVYSAYWIPPQP
ncbi:MAG: hypothetical protein ACAI35_09280 [Candidatus Methylacidiphilales bacterium]|nr:hypothetical protein [Candidatus Methylacidiphilales bacterium]